MKTITFDETKYVLVPLEAIKTLEFYANDDHRVTLSNIPRKEGFDWNEARENLESNGFLYSHEYSNGDEEFVETGGKARKALDKIYLLNDKIAESDTTTVDSDQ